MFHLCLAVLFFVLSPGVLLTLPPGSRGIFTSGQTSLAAAAVHALVFMVVAHLLWVYVIHPAEGFTPNTTSMPAAAAAAAAHPCPSGTRWNGTRCA
jgi:hypothetical protein